MAKNKPSITVLQFARRKATGVAPYFSSELYRIRLVPSKECPTMGVSKEWVCYYNPEKLDEWRTEEVTGVLLHEAMHLLFRHHSRQGTRTAIMVNPQTGDKVSVWNLATDIVINEKLREMGAQLPKNVVYADSFKFSRGLLEEQYYDLLMEKFDAKYGQNGNDSNGQGTESEFGGSCSDGQARPWEKEGDKESAPSELEQKAIGKQVAEAIGKFAGNVPGSLKDWAKQILAPTPIDWRKQLDRLIRTNYQIAQGRGLPSYARPNRRGNVDIAGQFKRLAKIGCVVDTSGSMDEGQLAEAFGQVQKISQSLSAPLNVAVCDTQATIYKNISKASQVKEIARGGTDMSAGLKALKGLADIVVVLTDGYTPWPSNWNLPVIVCIIGTQEKAPSWAKEIKIPAKG